uniref:Gag-Pol polyprotein n=1 Tax=Tanacetum cinerariifolium TaxID=118510 RepID=A0A699HBS7_TANCI|nr:hypothetical protein [Tanacetum cinerariifolium]
MMSPSGSIVASLENVNGFLAVYTPSDDLIRTDLEKKGVVPEVMLHILEEFVFLLGRRSLDNEIPCMNRTEQSRLVIFLRKEIFEGGMIRIHNAFVHDECLKGFNTLFGQEEWGIFLKKAAGFENRPPVLNKENYVPGSSRLLRYAKSRPNGNLIHNSIINGPYVRQMIPELGNLVTSSANNERSDIGIQEKKAKLFNEWERFTSINKESIEFYYHCFLKFMNDLKRNKHFPEKITSNLKFLNNLQPEWSRHVTIVHQTKDLHTTYYTKLYDFLNYNQNEVDDLKAEQLERTQDPLALMATSNNSYTFPVLHQDQPSFNQKYMQQPIPNSKDITNPTTVINMALALMAKAFKLNYSTQTNNNQRISSNLRNRQIAQPGMNTGQDRQMQMVRGNGENQFTQYAGRNVGNLNGYNAVQNVGNQIAQNAIQNIRIQNVGNQNRQIVVPGTNQMPNGNGNLVAARAEGNATRHNDLDEIEEVNANCILMANLHQASTSGTQIDKAPVYDSNGSVEVHKYENCYDNEIFNMFTQEEQYTELLEPIPEPHQVLQNDNNVISEVFSIEQSGGTVEQHLTNVEETRVLYDSLYNNLAIEVEKVKTVNRKLVLPHQTENGFGYQNPFYLNQAQQKQQSLYDGKVLFEKHDPPVMHDLEDEGYVISINTQEMDGDNQAERTKRSKKKSG